MSVADRPALEALRRAADAVVRTIAAARAATRPGVTTAEIDAAAAAELARCGARSAPQLVYDFPGAICISVNDEAVHGIPGERVVEPGDLVKLDVTAELGGWMADAAVTVALEPASERALALRACAEAALERGIAIARAGVTPAEVGAAVEEEVERWGFRVLRALGGHGIGRSIHEDPIMPNWADPDADEPLAEGLVVTIEPIIAESTREIAELDDGWTIASADGSLVAHAEHTLVIRRNRPPLVLTAGR
jgi:methionyl aminopeptidase